MDSQVKEIYQQMWLPSRYWGISENDAKEVLSEDRLSRLLGKSLFLYGNGLAGIKVAVYLIKREMAGAKKTGLWLSYFDIRDAAKKVFNDEYNLMERIKFVDILVLDGFYEGMMIPFEFREIVKYRWDWDKCTIIVYNGEVNWFVQSIDEGLANIMKFGYDLVEV